MHTAYDPALIVLSVAIAVVASYTALDLGSRVRTAKTGPRWAWIAGAAIAMGGGIWSMHFVGMLAFRMGLPAAYDFGLTIVSLLIAVGVTGAAFVWVSREGDGLRALLVSGPLMGIGVAAMHYTGMAAMRILGNVAYSLPLVGLSVAIAISAASAALWLTFRQHGVWQKLLAAVVMGVAVAGMHYTGMGAATFMCASGAAGAGPAALDGSQINLALSVAGATFVILFIAMLTSSLDQQRVGEELRLSEARFRAAVQAVRGVLWTTDASGNMVGEQPGWAAITGQTPAQYAGFGWANAVHPDDAHASVEAWQEAVREKRTFLWDHRLRSRDGLFRHYAVRAVPILDDNAAAVREWVGVHTDITEQREAEAELRESNDELQRYAYIVSHDLRAPLVSISGFVGELSSLQGDALATHASGSRINADFDEALAFIKASITRMERLIGAILKLSRDGRRSLRSEPLEMSALMQGLVDAQRHQFETVGAAVRIAADLPVIEADRVAVEQIFGNLIDNAVKYLDLQRAGSIEISGRVTGGGFAIFEVADNGRGIAARDYGRIFDLFRRVGAQDRDGEGIGLAHVKALVRSLGGRIDVTSTPGVGTTFSVTLPLRSAERHGFSEPMKAAAE